MNYSVTYSVNSKGVIKDRSYAEHLLSLEIKSKLNHLSYKLNIDTCKKEAYKILFKDRLNPHDWIEFHNDIGKYYTAVYYYLGGYIVRLNTESVSIQIVKHNILQNYKWYNKYRENYIRPNITSNLFSLTETVEIIHDMARINKLQLFK